MKEKETKNFMSGKHWIIILIILISGYGIFTGVSDLKKSKNQNWTDESSAILTKNCVRDAKEMAEKYPELTNEYCECSTDKIQAEFTQSEYIEITKSSIENQKQKLLSTFQSCRTNYQNKIKALN